MAGAAPDAVGLPYLQRSLGRRVSLDPAVIADKIILRRRGGYCFEQNTLFRVVLTALERPVPDGTRLA